MKFSRNVNNGTRNGRFDSRGDLDHRLEFSEGSFSIARTGPVLVLCEYTSMINQQIAEHKIQDTLGIVSIM